MPIKHALKRVLIVSLTLFSLLPSTVDAQENGDNKQLLDPDKTVENANKIDNRSKTPFILNASLGGAFALADDLELAGLGESGVHGTIGGDLLFGQQLAFSVISGLNSFTEGTRGDLRDLFVGAGFKMYFDTNESGALTEEGGSALGIVWLDVHLGYHRYRQGSHTGLDVGLGYDFALGREFNLGPFARLEFVPWGDGLHFATLALGIRMSLGGKQGLADRDGDGVEAGLDQCPETRENRNGFEDKDGCPDTRE